MLFNSFSDMLRLLTLSIEWSQSDATLLSRSVALLQKYVIIFFVCE